MTVLFGVKEGEPSPGPRYRVLQFLPSFQEAGVRCEVLTADPAPSTGSSTHVSSPARALRLARSWGRGHVFFSRVLRALDRADRVYLYRVPVPSWVVPALERNRDKLLYDFDDAIGVVDGVGAWQGLRQLTWKKTIERAIRCCRTIVTSNEYNAAAIRERGGTAVVIPTCVDTDKYSFRSRRQADPKIRIGWIGTPSTAPYLRQIEKPLARLAREREADVVLVGAGENPFADLPVKVVPWTLEDEIDQISRFDVGLMPMPDTPWTRGKAALKALQYGASGAPTVGSWTPTNEQILAPSGGTILCRTTDEWFQALLSLVDGPETRDEMGGRARRYVEANYSIRAIAPKLLGVVRGEVAAANS